MRFAPSGLRLLQGLGLPTVNVRGLATVENQYGLVYDRFSEGSKDIVGLLQGKVRAIGKSDFLNEQSVSDLQMIRRTLIDKQVRVDDLQFLIGQNGRIAISDPLNVKRAPPSDRNLRIIDLLIRVAQKNGG